MAAALVIATAGQAAALTSWSLVKAPVITTPANSDLSGESCTSASNCWAVGFVQTGSTTALDQTLAEHYNGTAWKVVSSPDSTLTADNELEAVACTSSSNCWAVGYHATSGSQTTTLIEHYNGIAWSEVATPPDPSGAVEAQLTGIACPSSSSCEAVGFYATATAVQTLTERLSGSSWSVVASGDTSTTATNQLTGVTCTGSSNCWAVGFYQGATAYQTLIEHYNGTAWSIVASPDQSATRTNTLAAVACPASTACWAVGFYSTGSVEQTLVERYNGTAWTIVASANKSASASEALTAIACTSGTACWGVGSYFNGTADQTLVERYNGTSWTIVSSPNQTTSHNNVLNAVSCPSSTSCLAAGDYNNGSLDQTLTEKFSGTSWTIVASANAKPTLSNALTSATCVLSTDCWAVGYYSDGVALQTLVEHYNGTTWKVVPSGDVNGAAEADNYLDGVTCISTASCWAVGYRSDASSHSHSLIEQYDGTSWTVMTAPDPGSDATLHGIACATSIECWAVGYYYNTTLNEVDTLILGFDGSSWTQATSSNPGTQGKYLWGVTCAGASECWAAGSYGTNTQDLTLIEEYNGTSWSTVSSPSPATDNELLSVACASQSSCWAAGDVGGNAQTLIEHYDGASWSSVTSPNVGTSHNTLDGVSCGATTACTAAGYYNNGANDLTLVEQYNGTAWARVSSPNQSSTVSNSLGGVVCTSSTVCWSVGSWGDNLGHFGALIAHGP